MSTDGSAGLHAVGVAKTFAVGGDATVDAVRGVSFAAVSGQIYGLLGPNGAGKTTLLRMLGTLITPSRGHAEIRDADGGVWRSDTDVETVRARIGFMSGNTRLYRRLTGRELLRYFGRLHGMADATIAARIDELVAVFDLSGFIDRRCGDYSTGQTQRVSIARVMVHDPPVLILDEPTLGLDIMSSRTMLDFVASARDRGRAVIFSTHHMSEAESLCDRVGFLFDGRLLAEGASAELIDRFGGGDLRAAFLAAVDACADDVRAAGGPA